jgi:sugar-specific transcriptional regulator TrmB
MSSAITLIRFGLSKEASILYLALLELPPVHVAQLSKKTNLHPTRVQKGLNELIERGCVSLLLQGKRRLYLAEHPEHLGALAEQASDELKQILPDLSERFTRRSPKPVIRFYQGKQGLRSVYEDLLRTLKKGDVFFRYESPEDYKKQDIYLPKAYFDRICKKREVQKFVITNEATAKRKSKQLERAMRVIPASFAPFQYNLTQIIYADKVAFLDFVTETAWIIENERFALFQRQLFRILFEKL